MFDYKDYILNMMDAKLKELMEPEEYTEFSTKIAREAFQMEIEGMAECDFKNFVKENFDEITK